MKRNLYKVCLALILLIGCSGCQMEKNQSTAGKDGQKVDIIKVEQRQGTDYAAVSEALLKMSMDECKKQGGTIVTEKARSDNGDCDVESFNYEDKENELVVVRAVDDMYCTAFGGEYRYKGNDYAGSAYMETLSDYGSADPCYLHRLRKDYPKEEIAACSKEEAIEKCKTLAEATGFGNGIVNVYAMTVDELNRNYESYNGGGAGRPSAKYLPDKNMEEYCENQEEWTKEYEAMYLVYQPVINGVEIDSMSGLGLEIIYSPKYNRIVYATWDMPYKDGAVLKKENIVPQDTAKQTVITSLGISANNIVFDNIKLVNTLTVKDTMLSDEHALVPVWRVDYHVVNRMEYTDNAAYKTTLVNALTGKICQYSLGD